MTVSQVFDEAARRGLQLKAAGRDKIAVVPGRLCSPDFAEILRQHKIELLSLLDPHTSKGLPERIKLNRELGQDERALLVRWCGHDYDAIIFAALNLFNGRIVAINGDE